MDVKRLEELRDELDQIRSAMRAQTIAGVRRSLVQRFFEIIHQIERMERHAGI